ncbi:hypothetical protein LEP1GSC127_2953 [Leptospira kirschneri str. 200801925]|uniref:Uncharacterized protein n=1 Tax=Leptospira kirschneri str. 200802841 TaxID=1193047 RepID=A0A828XW31_9LEPT|nr:hypothetical protein [Leptospira kirschneri]EKO51399.1 hypothetical protein LEP1GSC131_2035 [Leptospira kirschneri str. 200802841]EMO73975.1 hypothetical protein LEP1GSC127_2953 [Leptospira kirschneri str. 200801925]
MKIRKPEQKGEWHVLRLPAILEDGSSLWPEKFPIENVLKTRAMIGETRFSGLYQQIPMDTVERMFPDPIYEEPTQKIKTYAFWDPAFRSAEKKKDFNGFAAGGPEEKLFYVLAGEIWRAGLRESYDKVEKLCKDLNVSMLFIEKNKGEDALEIEMQRRGIPCKGIISSGNKDFRIQQHVRMVWDLLRFSKYVSQAFLRQVLTYTILALHDDAPDTLAGLMISTKFGPQAKDLKNRLGFFEMLLNEGRW